MSYALLTHCGRLWHLSVSPRHRTERPHFSHSFQLPRVYIVLPLLLFRVGCTVSREFRGPRARGRAAPERAHPRGAEPEAGGAPHAGERSPASKQYAWQYRVCGCGVCCGGPVARATPPPSAVPRKESRLAPVLTPLPLMCSDPRARHNDGALRLTLGSRTHPLALSLPSTALRHALPRTLLQYGTPPQLGIQRKDEIQRMPSP